MPPEMALPSAFAAVASWPCDGCEFDEPPLELLDELDELEELELDPEEPERDEFELDELEFELEVEPDPDVEFVRDEDELEFDACELFVFDEPPVLACVLFPVPPDC